MPSCNPAVDLADCTCSRPRLAFLRTRARSGAREGVVGMHEVSVFWVRQKRSGVSGSVRQGLGSCAHTTLSPVREISVLRVSALGIELCHLGEAWQGKSDCSSCPPPSIGLLRRWCPGTSLDSLTPTKVLVCEWLSLSLYSGG